MFVNFPTNIFRWGLIPKLIIYIIYCSCTNYLIIGLKKSQLRFVNRDIDLYEMIMHYSYECTY